MCVVLIRTYTSTSYFLGEYICVVGVSVMCVLYSLGQTPTHLIFSFNSKPQTEMRIVMGGRKNGRKKKVSPRVKKTKEKHEGADIRTRGSEHEGAALHPDAAVL